MNSLVKYRERHNLSQREMAKLLHMDQGYLCRIENGDLGPSLKVLIKMLDLGFDMNRIIREARHPE